MEYVVGCSGPPGHLRVVGRADEDTNAPVHECLERVLVGDVVTQVERHHVVAVETQGLEQVEHGFPLVPVELELYLVDHLAGRNPQLVGMLGEYSIHNLFDFRPLLFGDKPVVGRDRGFLRLDQRALDRVNLLVEPRSHLVKQRLESNAFRALDGTFLRAPDVEAVAAGDDQVVEAHELLHYPPVAPANHAHRAPPGQPSDGVPHALGDDSVLGTVHYGGQRAVVVEEDGRRFPGKLFGQLVTVGQRVRQIADVLISQSSPPHTRLSSARSRTTTSAPLFRRTSGSSPRATPMTRPKPPARPAMTPEMASSMTTARSGGAPSIRAASS